LGGSLKHQSNRYSGYNFDFQRINVILGANGAGKSKLLTEIRDNVSQITGGKKAVYIEGGRTIKIRDVLQLDHKNFGQFDRYESAVSTYQSKRNQLLADRVFDALIVLDKKQTQQKSAHSDAVEKWVEAGQKSEYPKRKQPPLEHLFELFTEIFPRISLGYNAEARKLWAEKDGNKYGPSGLSDGEKQVFSILADLIELEDDHDLIIADEPELNLHPELAERVWTLIENEFPLKKFIYATHSISFALRPNVNQVWVVSSSHHNITKFEGLGSLERGDVVSFLGAIPGILSADHVLVTEGHEKSFDAIFYRWLLGDSRLEIYPAGSCTDVEAVVKKSGLWGQIASSIRLQGVTDGDYKPASASPGIKTLDYHEAESYLSHPKLIVAVAERIGSQENSLTEEVVTDLIFDQLRSERTAIAARRAFLALRINLAASLPKKALAEIADAGQLVDAIADACSKEITKAQELFDKARATQLIQQELSKIDEIDNSRNLDAALKYIPGKELLQKLAPKAGCRNGADLMRSISKNFNASQFSHTNELREQLIAT
jgi:energy-coupling factor transporter ATP-binding protein EcfA2